VRTSGGTYTPVQQTCDGNILFQGSAPSLGYDTVYLSDQPEGDGEVTASISTDGTIVKMANSLMQLELWQQYNWAIYILQPIVNGVTQPDIIPNSEFGNTLVVYKDSGNLYNFGNELDASGLHQSTGTFTPGSAEVVESGPLRAVVRATLSFKDGTSTAEYTLEYTLIAGEPFVRMAVTGAAPLPPDPSAGGTPYAVMVRFPFAGAGASTAVIDGVVRGTPYHWYDQLPTPYWHGPTFQATHHFVVPSADGTTLGALYHADIPAWAIDDRGAMIGCILRNTPAAYPWPPAAEGRGANGVDFGVHTRRYALRVPQGLELPGDGVEIFEESAGFATPLLGAYINVPSEGVSPSHPVSVSFPTTFSLASVTSGSAILTVAKEGQFDPSAMILRIYQPTNGTEAVTVSLSDYITATGSSSPQVMPVTALEGAITGASALPVTDDEFTITMTRALATVAITPGT
jgi:alpha-mannosidase